MGWLLDNPLATMPGPHFLIFYAVFAAIALIVAYVFVDARDTTGGVRPPRVSGAIDPYELAYLRGGAAEVVRTAIYALRQQRLVEISGGGRIRTSGGSLGELGPIERRVYQAIMPEPTIASLFARRGVVRAVDDLCGPARARLAAQNLLRPAEVGRARVAAIAVGLVLLVALAAYKAIAALAHGHSNLGFLAGETFVAGALLVVVCGKAGGAIASKRGKAFLAQIRLAYAGQVGATLARPSAAQGGATALLMVGLYGFGVLNGTPDEALAREFARSRQAGGDGGDGGGGDGGGCGGCGGGD